MTGNESIVAIRRSLTVAILMTSILSCSKSETTEAKEIEPAPAAASIVSLTPEAIKSAGIVLERASLSSGGSVLRVTGTVESNQQQTQEVTPLVAGRVDRVYVAPGDSVRAGAELATLLSPEVAEVHGKLLEANAKLSLAQSTLRRTKKLSELGAAAGKDLAAAEAEEATARAEVLHLQEALRSLGAIPETRGHNVALVAVLSPISGVVTARNVNPGSGVEAGKTLFTVANLSTVWVIANVPESEIAELPLGSKAEIRAASLGGSSVAGRISYIDPTLNESTRTARVRIDVPNPGGRLRVGMFCEVAIEHKSTPGSQLTVAESAVQRIGDRNVVFVDMGGGRFATRDVTLGNKIGNRQVIVAGISAGDRVVTSGSFTLKSQLLKSQFAESD